MPTLDQNPFAALTLIAAPAVLTNACSVLALGTSNRFARAVDRQRQLSALLESGSAATPADREQAAIRLKQLHTTEQRGRLLLRAMTSFYLGLGCFAAASLVSLLGAIVHEELHTVVLVLRWLAMSVGALGVGGLVVGSTTLVRETRITLFALREEAMFTSRRFNQKHGQPIEEEAAESEKIDDERA